MDKAHRAYPPFHGGYGLRPLSTLPGFTTPIRLDDGAEVRIDIAVGMAAPVSGETSVHTLLARAVKSMESDKGTRRV